MKPEFDNIILVLVFLVAGYRLYIKYGRKNSGTSFLSRKRGKVTSYSEEDEYEPYSKK